MRYVAAIAALAWVLRSLFFQPFYIPSGSMLPSLYVGDYLIVAKWPYGYSRYSFPFDVPQFSGRLIGRLPDRGDVIVFRHPTEKADLIKRVIGLPGDIVEMRKGVIILNGKIVRREPLEPAKIPVSVNSPCRPVDEGEVRIAATGQGRVCLYNAFLEVLPGGRSYVVLTQLDHGPGSDLPPTRVPRANLFVMGDNRDDSLDSRFPTTQGGVGMLPMDNLVGKALVTFWSTDGSASYPRPWTWFTALRARRIGNIYTGHAK